MSKDKPIVISFLNQKGGVGKTTSATNVACSLAKSPKVERSNKKVLLLDLDFQGNSSSSFLEGSVIRNSLTTYQFIINNTVFPFKHSIQRDLENKIFKDFIKTANLKNCDLDIMPNHLGNAGLDLEITAASNREGSLKKAFFRHEEELSAYKYIIIDCPPALSLSTINALVVSDYALIPTDADKWANDGLNNLLETMENCNKHHGGNVKLLGIFITQFVKRESVYQASFEELKKAFGNNLWDITISRNTAVKQSTYRGPIVHIDPTSQASRDYLKLTNEILRKTKHG